MPHTEPLHPLSPTSTRKASPLPYAFLSGIPLTRLHLRIFSAALALPDTVLGYPITLSASIH